MKKTALATGAAALVISLSGCGAHAINGTASTDPQLFGNAQELVRAATNGTEKAKSAKFSMESSIAGLDMNGQGAGRFDGENTAMRMTMHVATVDEEIRYVDKTMYIQLPEQTRARMTGGKPWGKVDPDSALGKEMGAAQAQQNDPSQTLQQIQEAGTIKRSEETTLDGQQATHYWIDMDLAKVADKLAEGSLSQAAIAQLKGKVSTIPVEVWLDKDQLPMQFTENLTEVMKAAGGGTGPATLTMKYSDWGTPVDVQAPPADQVGELKLPG
ncbi:LppX_LprAFG lipoprotein [Amycolatopsis acidicola]|uniref:LppX_LprAFG lipoprotein n=1 Tax=Amycolatopsis acidicola TaxID=2596893 RepID=A0A5N0VB66_9PSEU|nr:LppX_LprAFG lipoprotein [Amycolatopsis acidicola]KAA9162360.1 LppX_LprAFG lipoprotein [Amycolatopsis acidicola]